MYILGNALKNLARNRGRNFLLAAVSFAIIATTVVALIINNTAAAVIADYKERFASEVTISPDMTKLREQAQANATDGRVRMTMPQIAPELLLSFAESEYLDHVTASAGINANSDQIKALDQSDSDSNNSNSAQANGGNNRGAGGGNTAIGGGFAFLGGGSGNFQLKGGDVWQEFEDGTRVLEDGGALPQAENECVISRDLADENALSVGSSLSFTARMSLDAVSEGVDISGKKAGDTVDINGITYTLESYGREADELRVSREVTYTFTITGIYEDAGAEYSNESMTDVAALNSRNQILTTLDTLLAPRAINETSVRVTAAYFLKDPSMLSAFETELRAKGLSDSYTVSTDTAGYNQVVKPVEGLKQISMTFLLVVVVLGAIILILLSAISVRERKYEIGVLRAMGMKKGKVALGLMTESLVITALCLLLGLGAGIGLSQPVASGLLKQQAAVAEETQEQANQGFASQGRMAMGGGPGQGRDFQVGGGTNSNTSVQPLSEMKITVGADTIGEIIGIALLLGLVTGGFAVSRITKYEPIKILMERN